MKIDRASVLAEHPSVDVHFKFANEKRGHDLLNVAKHLNLSKILITIFIPSKWIRCEPPASNTFSPVQANNGLCGEEEAET